MRKLGQSGKALTFILVIFIVLLLSLTGISLFFFLKEIDLHKAAEYQVEQLKAVEAKLQAELKSAQDQIVFLEEKKKDAEFKIEGLMQEVDLQKSTKEQVQKENQELQANLQKEAEAKEELRARLTQDLQAAQEKYNTVKAELDKVMARNKELEDTTRTAGKVPAAQRESMTQAPIIEMEQPLQGVPAGGVELEKIVVNPVPSVKGKVISVDSETDFAIVSLGEKDGINKGSVLAVYRGEDYLGDLKVSRVLAAMSAADFIPPLKSQSVKKDDQVVIKK